MVGSGEMVLGAHQRDQGGGRTSPPRFFATSKARSSQSSASSHISRVVSTSMHAALRSVILA